MSCGNPHETPCSEVLDVVYAFLDGELPFTGIAEVVARALDAIEPAPVRHFSDLYKADAAARETARSLVQGVAA